MRGQSLYYQENTAPERTIKDQKDGMKNTVYVGIFSLMRVAFCAVYDCSIMIVVSTMTGWNMPNTLESGLGRGRIPASRCGVSRTPPDTRTILVEQETMIYSAPGESGENRYSLTEQARSRRAAQRATRQRQWGSAD
jgi:hypothetical protein